MPEIRESTVRLLLTALPSRYQAVMNQGLTGEAISCDPRDKLLAAQTCRRPSPALGGEVLNRRPHRGPGGSALHRRDPPGAMDQDQWCELQRHPLWCWKE